MPLDPAPPKRGRFVGAGAGPQAIVLIAGVLLIALLVALVSLIVRDVIRQLSVAEEVRRPTDEPSLEPPSGQRSPQQPQPVGAVRPLSPSEWVTSDDYPLDAIRAGLQGTVSFTLDVSAGGLPTACRITQSSGHLMLDEATCALMMKRARFDPARDATGSTVTAQYSRRVTWVLPE